MKVTIFKTPGLLEDYAEIHCAAESPSIRRLADYIELGGRQLTGKCEGETGLLTLDDIFYFESVDKKTFACLEHSVWEMAFSLKEAEERFFPAGFIRISRTLIVNLSKVERLKNDFEMRMLLMMENGETLVLNRHYRKNLKNCLEEMKKNLLGGDYEADGKE